MSYTPTNWRKGDKITSDKLNHLEQGVADLHYDKDEVVVVHVTAQWDSATEKYINVEADKSASEVFNFIKDGKDVLVSVKESNIDSYRWLSLVYSDDKCVRFSNQELHDNPDNRYDADIYTLEFTL